jgi:hypothetical protein
MAEPAVALFVIDLVVIAPVPFPIRAAPDVRVVAPVPPLATDKVPVIPGLGDVLNTVSAVVDPRFTNIEGLVVIPVPPYATATVVPFHTPPVNVPADKEVNPLNVFGKAKTIFLVPSTLKLVVSLAVPLIEKSLAVFH